MNQKKITLCADDYSFTPAISEAIIQLINKNRLSAVSCMTNTEHWQTHANWLKPHINKIDIGLHFTLTDVPSENSLSLSKLILQAHTKQLSFEQIHSEIKMQIDHFQQALGVLPDFIDGHQHVHQLPIVRQALLAAYKENFPKSSCYIRVPTNGLLSFKKPFNAALKSTAITLTGAAFLKRMLSKHKIPFNTSFSGVYNFADAQHYPHYFRCFLENIKPNGLIMCHPGFYSEKSTTDGIARQRSHEYEYFNSNTFLQDCERFQVRLGRLIPSVLA